MDGAVRSVDAWRVAPLGPVTWDLFAGLAERHNGVFGGCWCTYFHLLPDPPERREIGHRELKRRLVEQGRAHAALVLDASGPDGADEAVAWAEFGPVEELANIHHRKQWEKETVVRPDYRITCLFVDRRYRRTGMAAVAVRGALALIAEQGGGLVESYPHDLPPGKKTSSSFLYNATRTMYERLGFTYLRPKGQGNCVMSSMVASTTGTPAA
ncbi:GNAT family N-acetyltransferase [Cellulomonas endophytica]|uniref:GNAT family N-acetyltransferase n=1 Tax=Cellulomonas endophytica TaxID=2494735 RepID=UPI0010105D54|nr:GNAT family N-acetyltransferase [Cellulomonas endophytica]